MSITVATVVLNGAHDLALTLESVVAQTHTDREILVLDGASWDATPEVLSRYANVIDRLEVAEDAGLYDAMNRAAAIASKEFVLFMNAGDLFHSETALEKLWVRRSATADIVYGDHIHRGRGVDTLQVAGDFGAHRDALREGRVPGGWPATFPCHQATLIRAALLHRLGFDTSFRIAGDHDFFLRAAAGGARIEYVDEIIAHYFDGGISTQRPELARLELNAIYRQHTRYPFQVDAQMGTAQRPFAGIRTPRAGSLLDGLAGVPLPGQAGGHGWRLAPCGARLETPSQDDAHGLALRGWNAGDEELELEVRWQGARVASATFAPGAFVGDLLFPEPLPLGSEIMLAPRNARGETRLTFEDWGFIFAETAPTIDVGDTVTFARANADSCEPYMESGWQGCDVSLAWTRERRAVLKMASADAIETISLHVRANPALVNQHLIVRLNEVPLVDAAIGGEGERALTLSVDEVWRPRGIVNRLSLHASALAAVRPDPRQLGVALARLSVR